MKEANVQRIYTAIIPSVSHVKNGKNTDNKDQWLPRATRDRAMNSRADF